MRSGLQKLDTYKSKYPKELKPNASVVYRGRTISFEDFIKTNWNETAGPQLYSSSKELKYKSKTLVQSWSTKESIAKEFMQSTLDNFTLDVFISLDYINWTSLVNKAKQLSKITPSIKNVKSLRKYEEVGQYTVMLLDDNFSDSYAKSRNRIPVMLETLVDDTFIFSNKFLTKRYQEHAESEIIRFTNKPIKCKMFIYKHTFQSVEFLKTAAKWFIKHVNVLKEFRKVRGGDLMWENSIENLVDAAEEVNAKKKRLTRYGIIK